MQALVTLLCGTGFVVDWNAVSALATTAAVLVALWIPARDRRARHIEKLYAEARAAQIVSQKIGSVVQLMPQILELITQRNGVLVDNAGTNVLYGVDACSAVLEGEVFCHQLPFAHLATAELVCALARRWKLELQTQLQAQRDPSLTQRADWHERPYLRDLVGELHSSAIDLRARCLATQLALAEAAASFPRRVLGRIRRLVGK